MTDPRIAIVREWLGVDNPYERCGELLARLDAQRDAELLAIVRDLARALCLGQRGFGFQGDRLPDIDEARKRCARLLELLGEEPNRRYDR